MKKTPPAETPAPTATAIDSTPVVHYVNVWLKPCGAIFIGDRNDSLSIALGRSNNDAKRICILKITTTVEIA